MTGYKVTASRGGQTLGSFVLAKDAPTECDLKVYRGDTFRETFAFTDATTGVVVPLTGTWTAQVRQDANATLPLATFALDFTQAAQGIVTLSLDSPTTTLLTPGLWDLQETDTNGTVTTWLTGTVAIQQDISH